MAYRIHEMSKSAQDQAKSNLEAAINRNISKRGFGFTFDELPYVIGTGVTEGALVVVVDRDDPNHENIYDIVPHQLDESFSGLPVIVQVEGRPVPLQGPRGGGGGGSGVIQGGMGIRGAESGTCFGILQDSQGAKYAVTSSHVLQNSQRVTMGGCIIGKTTKDARPCGQKVYLDAAAALINQGIQVSSAIQSLGTPKGFMKPTIGMPITQIGQTSGKFSFKVTTINFSMKNVNTNAPGTKPCSVTFEDLWAGSTCGTNGDSGGPLISDQGYLIGICTFGSTTKGGKNDPNCKSYNPSVVHIPEIMGLNLLGTGAEVGSTSLTPQQRKGQKSGWSDYQSYSRYNFPTIA
jgi:S1-C subfamily serine protease